ncbi:hypothetical protein BH11PSE8_BH11PSE8_32220 [soil metagenome]
MFRKFTSLAATALATLALTGCASLDNIDSEVSSFSQWPAQRTPASYVFERLPSQQAQPEQQQMLEDAARAAVEGAGFKPAGDAAAADFSIQLGARITGHDRSPFDDPFWAYGGFGPRFGGFYGRGGRAFWPGSYGGFGWYSRFDTGLSTYEREVGVLIRDRKTGQTLYEARANNEGLSPAAETVLPAMFAAAMKDFPNGGVNPRHITIVPATRAPASDPMAK